MAAPQINIDPKTALVVTGVVMVGILLIAKLPSVKEVVNDTTDLVGGVLSGNNAITNNARTDAYKSAGAIGTLGAATDTILGGVPSKIGEWLGGTLYDIFNPAPAPQTTAPTRRGATGTW